MCVCVCVCVFVHSEREKKKKKEKKEKEASKRVFRLCVCVSKFAAGGGGGGDGELPIAQHTPKHTHTVYSTQKYNLHWKSLSEAVAAAELLWKRNGNNNDGKVKVVVVWKWLAQNNQQPTKLQQTQHSQSFQQQLLQLHQFQHLLFFRCTFFCFISLGAKRLKKMWCDAILQTRPSLAKWAVFKVEQKKRFLHYLLTRIIKFSRST